MKILVVEDNYEKIKMVHDVFKNSDKPVIETVASVSEAVFLMTENQYELVVLDVQIPDIEGGEVNPMGGAELLNQIECCHDINIPKYLIGVSRFVSEESKDEFSRHGWMLFHVESEKARWSNLLLDKASSMSHNVHCKNVDIGIVTALEHTELEAVLKLDCNWRKLTVDGFLYHLGEIQLTPESKVTVVSTASERMGVASASEMTARVCSQFRPKIMLMTGICAGIRGKVELGDLIVADYSWDWGAGKFDEDGDGNLLFSPDPHQIPLDAQLRKQAKSYTTNCDFMYEANKSFGDKTKKRVPEVHLAPMACGSQVLANESKVEEIKGVSRKLLAIEMESYGFLNVCNSMGILGMVCKSVCDFADREKDDGSQEYAAHVSAVFAYNFVKEQYSTMRKV